MRNAHKKHASSPLLDVWAAADEYAFCYVQMYWSDTEQFFLAASPPLIYRSDQITPVTSFPLPSDNMFD